MSAVDPAALGLPPGMLIAFYGDDLTGSTAVMEVLTLAGVPTALFLDGCSEEQVTRFSGYRAVGIAGMARSKSPQWMQAELPDVYRGLNDVGAPLVHYKVCSTLDSSPQVGSIGCAIDIGASIVGGAWYPVLVAAPALGRYQAFGNLFAIADGEVHRLDRHPIMAGHPVTPMDEADTRRHLARQTDKRFGLVDYVSMKAGKAQQCLQSELANGAEVISLDVVDDDTLVDAGRLIWENRGERLFVIGSQGIEYALTAYWRHEGWLPAAPEPVRSPAVVERIACVSGSCSAVTAAQIEHAVQHGFAPIPLDATQAVDEAAWQSEILRATRQACRALEVGADPLVFTARNPADLAQVTQAIAASGCAAEAVQTRIGMGLGKILSELVVAMNVRRVVVAGGDTSSHVAKALGITALSMESSLAPGAPICRAHGPGVDGMELEIAFKGGQMGRDNYFSAAKGGNVGN